MPVICVTGASGKAGRAVVADLLAHDLEVQAIDLVAPPVSIGVPVLQADLCDYGQAVEALAGASAVIHLANIPAPGRHTPAVTFSRNTAMNYAVFAAAAQVGMDRIVWASSETTLGLPFAAPPRYVPVDEDHYPFPTSAYALSKVASETVAAHLSDWSGIPSIALRLSNILGPGDYEGLRACWPDPRARRWNLWGYVDERDVAAACRLALTAPAKGSTALIVAAADTVMNTPSARLMAEVFPDVPARRELAGFETVLSIESARAVLGYEPAHSWRDYLTAD